MKNNRMRGRIVYTLLMIVALIVTMAGIIGYMFKHSEAEAQQRLRLETARFKTNINIQVNSDLETLRSMASLMSERYNDEDSYTHVCKNFEAFGFCENIGILLPDNRLVTKVGAIDVSDGISYKYEARLGEYVSGRVKDITNDKREVVRSAVPIKSPDGETVAIMYGTIDIERLVHRYREQAESIGAYLSIIDGKSGQFIVDTKNTSAKYISRLSHVRFKGGYDFNTMSQNIKNGNSGYTAFIAHDRDEFLYAHYSKLDIADWRIMMAQPESVVFAGTRATIKFLLSTSAIILIIMLIYVLCILWQIRRMLRMNSYAADIRKSLIEMNQRGESLEDALQILSHFADSRSAFIIDSYGDIRYFISPGNMDDRLREEDVEYFNENLLVYATRRRKNHSSSVYVSQIRCNTALKEEMPNFHRFMVMHKIGLVKYAVVVNSKNNIYMLGVANPRKRGVAELLSKIAVCFSMAVYGKDHLTTTEHMALSDSLTGIANRMAFKRDIERYNTEIADIACIYVDVNELHFYNNKFGHAAGDQMLIYIVSCLNRSFSGSSLYRMGGDEFLIITQNMLLEEIDARIADAVKDIEEMQYHVATGVAQGSMGSTVWKMVNTAEKIMYENKTRYYQDKELSKVKNISNGEVVTFETGNGALDACLSVMSLKYLAVYCVSFDKDKCVRILAPSFFQSFVDENDLFSASIKRYFYEMIKPEYHRTLLKFLDYEMLQRSFSEGHVPSTTYERIDGEKVFLKIYPVNTDNDNTDSVWVFEKIDE